METIIEEISPEEIIALYEAEGREIQDEEMEEK